MAGSYGDFNPSGRRMFFSSISSFHPIFSSFHVQSTIPNDVQSLHSYDAVASSSMLSVTATSSVAIGTCTVHTLFPNSTMPGHSFTTVDFTYIHGPSLTTTTQHPIITYRFCEGIWFRPQ